ncbi:unnamed protein product, partial [Candidula unifasciata]
KQLLVHGMVALDVVIWQTPPSLHLSLPSTDKSIGAVRFHYTINNREYQAQATQTGEGWRYTIPQLLPGVAGVFHVYAVVYDVEGKHLLTTAKSSLELDRTSQVARLPTRRLRGAAYFRDDFNSLSRSNWDIEVSMYGGWNGEFQVYTNDPKNVFTRGGGSLYLKPVSLHRHVSLFGYCSEAAENGCTRRGSNGLLPPVMSGKVNSVPTMKYGVLEVRAKVPRGNWLWPAIWMLPKDSVYGSSPRSGEIDVMEYY